MCNLIEYDSLNLNCTHTITHNCGICNQDFHIELFLKHYLQCHKEKIKNIIGIFDDDISEIKIKNTKKIANSIKKGYISLGEICKNCVYNIEDIEDI